MSTLEARMNPELELAISDAREELSIPGNRLRRKCERCSRIPHGKDTAHVLFGPWKTLAWFDEQSEA